MAGDAVVGVLRAIFGLDTSEFEDGAKKAASSMQSFGKKMTEIASGIGLEKILEKTGEALLHLVKGALETADAMGKASQKFGVPIEQLSSLAHVAALSDLSLQQLGQGLGKLSKNMIQAQDSTSQAGLAFGALGIEVKDSQGKLKSSEAVLLEIASRFASFEDGATKTALAIAIFGKAGADMIPLLNQGADSIQKQREQAEKLGQVISKETAKQAEEFNDSLKALHRTMDAVVLKILGQSGLLEAMSRLAVTFVETAAHSDAFGKGGEEGGKRIGNMTTAVDVLTNSLKALGEIGYGTVAPLWYLFVKQDPSAALQSVKDAIGGVGKAFEGANQALKENGNILLPLIDDWTQLTVVQKAASVVPPPKFDPAATKAIDDFVTATKKSIEAQKASNEAHGQGVGVREQLRIIAEANLIATEKGTKLTDQQTSAIKALAAQMKQLKIDAAGLQLSDQLTQLKAATLEAGGAFAGTLAPGFAQAALSSELLKNQVQFVNGQLIITGEQARQLNAAMLGLAGAKLTAEFLDPWTLFETKVKSINALLTGDFPISLETARLATLKAAGEMASAWGTVAASITTPIASAFKDLASMNKKYAGIAKAAAIGEALVNTYLGATKAFTATVQFGVPLAIAAAAAATAAGLANVAKISATQFQTGGSFKVGGSGGVDSQLISLRASPGEMVDVRRPDSGRGAGGVQTIQLQAPSPKDFFASHIRELVDTLNAAAPDGYILKMGY